jgi:hypothetical protein
VLRETSLPALPAGTTRVIFKPSIPKHSLYVSIYMQILILRTFSGSLPPLHFLGHCHPYIFWLTTTPKFSRSLPPQNFLCHCHPYILSHCHPYVFWVTATPTFSGSLPPQHSLGHCRPYIYWVTATRTFSGSLSALHFLGYCHPYNYCSYYKSHTFCTRSESVILS